MRLLIVTRAGEDDRLYGLDRAVSRIAAELGNRGHYVEVCSARDWSVHDRRCNARLCRQLSAAFRFLGWRPEVAVPLVERWIQGQIASRRWRRMGATHIWFQDPWLAVVHVLQTGWRVSRRLPVWGITHHGCGSSLWAAAFDGLPLDQRTLARLLTWERRILLRAGWVWFPSYAARQQTCRDLGIFDPPCHWRVLGYGAPEPLTLDRAQARALLGWRSDDCHVLAVGRISPVKRMHRIVEACARVQAFLQRKVHLTILGHGDTARIEQVVQRTGFHPEIFPVDDVRPYLAAADVYMSASKDESFGLANQDAIAAGLPCILSCGGATCEVAGQGAWLVDGSVESLTEALAVLLTDENTRDFWRRRAERQRRQWPGWGEIIGEAERQLLALET